ncbi:MAG: hypothetical protein JWR69_903 [Pedosphaera sp.]|nr:hypothetical protein [Pedosphaera sp.]
MALNVIFWVFLVCVFAAMAVPCFVLFIMSGACFQNTKWKGTFSFNQAYLFYDQASQRVYFFSQGID